MKWGREKPQRAGSYICAEQRKGEESRKYTLPESSWRERVATPTTDLTRKGQRIKETVSIPSGLINKGGQYQKSRSPLLGGALVGRVNPQEQAEKSEGSLGHTGRSGSPARKASGRGLRPPHRQRSQGTPESIIADTGTKTPGCGETWRW